ncbi:hypothetical protein B9Z39_02465 [Limnohabitans sp. JirII-29]|uniref:DUF5625 family protein n=1 Tax=Limnohabitans sp. JirII-29 TaxID=1835756 RepID=UPI000D36F2B7|nr:DUF5625 family protein [Limnohabitans sp. JirII-29]PUE30395.1 hypothetical protein B9Z39_02465 [Limnohabitans sp. JirII-29]
MNKPRLIQQAARDDCTIKDKARRGWLVLFSGAFLSTLCGCKDDQPITPLPPYGRALDVTQANTFVEFDIRIEKPDRYDVVLEIFTKSANERVPNSVWEIPDAHFKVRIQSVSVGAEMVVVKEVVGDKKPYGVLRRSYFSPSSTNEPNQMSMTRYLVHEQPLNAGTYSIRCDNLNPIPVLQGRLVKVTVEPKIYHK